jgi:soluble lytic murein transglycosylase-like protein
MVSPAARLAAALVLAAPGPAQADPWSRAGGELIFATEPGAPGPAAPPTTPAPTPRPTIGAAPAGGVAPSLEDGPFGAEIRAAAARHGLDPKLLAALVAVESAFRPDAVSPAGAVGLTQLMPATAVELGVLDRRDPAESLDGGAAYLARQLARFGDVRLALAAFNAGPERVARAGGVPPIAETRRYTIEVVDCFLALTAGREVRSAADCRREETPP